MERLTIVSLQNRYASLLGYVVAEGDVAGIRNELVATLALLEHNHTVMQAVELLRAAGFTVIPDANDANFVLNTFHEGRVT